MKARSTAVAALVAALTAVFGGPAPASAALVADSINAGATPCCSWDVREIGWLYTPATGYDLIGIETKFADTSIITVTLELYDEAPSTGPATLLASGPIIPVANAFVGILFAPITLVAGEDYFVGVRNVDGAPGNFTMDAGAVEAGGQFSSHDIDPGLYQDGPDFGVTNQPILRFLSPVPLPGAVLLLGSALAALGGIAGGRRLRGRSRG